MKYDYLVVGAGLYGLRICSRGSNKGEKGSGCR